MKHQSRQFRWFQKENRYPLSPFLMALSAVLWAWTAWAENVPATGAEDRAYTLSLMRRIADPVLVAASEKRLLKTIPKRNWELANQEALETSPEQAFGRTLSGIAPWLALGPSESEEGKLRARYIQLAVKGLINACDPNGPDYLFAKPSRQRVVDVAYIAYPLLVAKEQLWTPLSDEQKAHVIEALKSHRKFTAPENNWKLFKAITECAIWEFTGECEKSCVEIAVGKHMEWYLGDGTYGDGKSYHWDYYNGYVIQPLLLETLRVAQEKGDPLGNLLAKSLDRGQRYAEVLEHLISPEGTFPVLGRSSTYRFAVFQPIGYLGFRGHWPKSLSPGATRAALTAVIRRMGEAPGTFDADGWLNAGVVGNQVASRDGYNSTGALYMCVHGFSHLGMPPEAPFWSEPATAWFQQRVWSGQAIPNQHALQD